MQHCFRQILGKERTTLGLARTFPIQFMEIVIFASLRLV